MASTGTFHHWRDDCYARNGTYECECRARPSDFAVDLSDVIISNMLALAALFFQESAALAID